MNYVVTNVRLPEDDYLKLKQEAAKRRTSLASIIREKVADKKSLKKSPDEIIKTIRRHAVENAEYLHDIDIVKTVREMRNKAKW